MPKIKSRSRMGHFVLFGSETVNLDVTVNGAPCASVFSPALGNFHVNACRTDTKHVICVECISDMFDDLDMDFIAFDRMLGKSRGNDYKNQRYEYALVECSDKWNNSIGFGNDADCDFDTLPAGETLDILVDGIQVFIAETHAKKQDFDASEVEPSEHEEKKRKFRTAHISQEDDGIRLSIDGIYRVMMTKDDSDSEKCNGFRFFCWCSDN